MDALLHDIRYGARQLWRSPAFTVAALATLALGIGANTALFTLGNAILGKPLPGIMESEQLVWVMQTRRSGMPTQMSYLDYLDYRAGLSDLVDLAAVGSAHFSVSSRGDPERVRGEIVSGNFFSVLRTPFALGRGFAPSEDSVGNAKNVVVLSYNLWQRRLSGDSAILGKPVIVNGQPLTVIGITGQGFNGADLESPRDLWLTIATNEAAWPGDPSLKMRSSWVLSAIGRMKTGVAREEIEAGARMVAARTATADSTRRKGMAARVYTARSGLPPGSEGEVIPVAILSGVVTGLVLLIACANVSNLLLARAVSRRREIAVRLSLGATRWRLVRQLFTEGAILAAVAGALGLLLAYWLTESLVSSGVIPLQLELTPDGKVITFALAAALASAILFGLVPALESARGDIAGAVKDGAQGRDPRRTRLQSTFVVTQLALSLTLLTTAGLFLRSMYKAHTIDIGFEASSRLLALSFDLGLQQYTDDKSNAFIRELSDKTSAMAGVETVSFTNVTPLGNRYIATEITLDGQPAGSGSSDRETQMRTVFESAVRPGYFHTLGMSVVRGRDFTPADDLNAESVVVVSDATARALWPNQDPLGKRISLRGEKGKFLTVVGVASDVMLGGPSEVKRSTVYVPQLQYPEWKRLTMLVRASGETGPLTEAIRREIRGMDANLPLFDVHSMAEIKRLKLSDRMNGASILGGFGALALLLASIGVYGVMAFSVMQRTKEIGIRVALGARGSDVVSLFVGRGMRLTLIGVVIGMTLSLALSKLLQGMLFGLTPTDGATFVGVAALLAGVALLAAWLPARRAARVDPMQALRHE